jgi:hypothetical protein
MEIGPVKVSLQPPRRNCSHRAAPRRRRSLLQPASIGHHGPARGAAVEEPLCAAHDVAVRLLCQAAAAAVLQADLEDPAARGAAGSDRLLDPTPLDSDRDLTPAEQQRPRALVPSAAGIAADLDPVMHAATSWFLRARSTVGHRSPRSAPPPEGRRTNSLRHCARPPIDPSWRANPTPPAPGPGPTAARSVWLSTGTALPAAPVGWHVAASVPPPGVVEDRRPCSR